MSRTTDQLRGLWAPHCQGPWAKVGLYGGATVSIDPLIVESAKALNTWMADSFYEATPPDCGAYNCRAITGGTKYSLHAYGIAIDINWQANPYGPNLITDMPMSMILGIEGIRTNGGHRVWRWGGRYSGNKDAMHFEIIASPAEITLGIDWSTAAGNTPSPIPVPQEEETMLRIIKCAAHRKDQWPELFINDTAREFKTNGTAEGTEVIPSEGHRYRLINLRLARPEITEESPNFIYELLTDNGRQPENLAKIPGLEGTKPRP